MRAAPLLALALAACAPSEDFLPKRPPPTAAPAPAPPPVRSPPPRSTPPPRVTPPPAPTDACGASQMQHLVGRPRSEIPIPIRPSLQRVACTTCPVTLDYNPERLNFFFDAATGIIKEIRCG